MHVEFRDANVKSQVARLKNDTPIACLLVQTGVMIFFDEQGIVLEQLYVIQNV